MAKAQLRTEVFKSLLQWLAEFRLYRRDEKGKVVKERDQCMDATRYLEMELLNICRTEPPKRDGIEFPFRGSHRGGGTWMGRAGSRGRFGHEVRGSAA